MEIGLPLLSFCGRALGSSLASCRGASVAREGRRCQSWKLHGPLLPAHRAGAGGGGGRERLAALTPSSPCRPVHGEVESKGNLTRSRLRGKLTN